MLGGVFRSILAWANHRKYRSVMIVVLTAAVSLAILLLVVDGRIAAAPITEIRRNSYGHGSVRKVLRVFIDGVEQKDSIEVSVGERRYNTDEQKILFARAVGKLEKLILGENKSLDKVQSDLDLVTQIPEEPIKVFWELNRYDLMNIYGELNEKNLQKESDGVYVKLRAHLTYTGDETKEVIEELTAVLYPSSYQGKTDVNQVRAAIEEEEESKREEKSLRLPSEVGGKKVQLRNPGDARGWFVLALGPIICGLLVGLERQEERQEIRRKEEQMMQDYPEVLNKLALLVGAGMTVKNAWLKIVWDYEKQKERKGERIVYEEMATASREMQSGMTELESYERFGMRCGLKAYRKLAAILTQNLRKGTKGLTELLKTEADQAFEDRKAEAKRKGEEAGTKLLAPMFLMLAMVLVIVIIPAFMSVQM